MRYTQMTDDEKRRLTKVLDTLIVVQEHLFAEAEMNAALHMADVRPAPLAMAVARAVSELAGVLDPPVVARGEDDG
jgi:hypothetical protein